MDLFYLLCVSEKEQYWFWTQKKSRMVEKEKVRVNMLEFEAGERDGSDGQPDANL